MGSRERTDRVSERMASFFPPLPPKELRDTACGGPSEQSHLHTSLEDLETITGIYETFSEQRFDELDSVLDFGCGCGRLMRWLPMLLPNAVCHGVDVRRASIEWCRANLKGRFVTSATQPPLELPDNSMDLIISLSVFSHLNRRSSLEWIAELARVCRTGGRILLTTLGPFSLWVLTRSEEHQKSFEISAAVARACRDLGPCTGQPVVSARLLCSYTNRLIAGPYFRSVRGTGLLVKS